MRLEKAAILLLSALMGFVACSDSVSEDVLSRVDENGVQYSPTEMNGQVYFLKTMIPESMRVINVDEKLNPLDSVDAELTLSTYSGSYSFWVPRHDYQQPYAKIVTVFPLDSKSKMEFPQYVRLQEYNDHKELSFANSMITGRVETLVREKGLDFEQAWSQAVSELKKSLNYSLDDVFSTSAEARDMGYNRSQLGGMSLYIYCHHEISDKEFYSTYQDFYKSFAKNGYVDESLIVDAADVWLSTFVSSDMDGRTFFKSNTRDSDVGVKYLSPEFLEHAYGVDLSVSWDEWNRRTDKFVTIENKNSMYDGRTLIYDAAMGGWRLQSLLEDSIGVCMSNKDSVAQNGDAYYRCLKNSATWEKLTVRDTLLDAVYGKCGGYYIKHGFMAYLWDSLFVCECMNSESCAWSDKYFGQSFDEGDSLYANYINAKATQQFGQCTKTTVSERKMDDLFVYCSWDRWRLMDSLDYYLGNCSDSNYTGEHSGKYYACKNFGEYDAYNNKWAEIPAPAYYGDKCFIKQAEDKMTLECKGDYFICDVDNGYYKWRKISKEEIDESVEVGVCSITRGD